MSEELAERAEQLAAELIGPLLLGGTLQLQRPFGAKLALTIGHERRIVDNDLRTTIDLARVRAARQVAAVDVLPELDSQQWALACALNDLLQVTNHELSSFASRSRHPELLEAVHETCNALPPPRNLAQVVARHTTFSRAPKLSRLDQNVTWWTGSESFRGQTPPARLLAWPDLRRVKVTKQKIPLGDMCADSVVDETDFHAALANWLSCTPLTDLSTAGRRVPVFRWSARALAVVATASGSNLALRALWAATTDATQARTALAALQAASAQLTAESRAKTTADAFAQTVAMSLERA